MNLRRKEEKKEFEKKRKCDDRVCGVESFTHLAFLNFGGLRREVTVLKSCLANLLSKKHGTLMQRSYLNYTAPFFLSTIFYYLGLQRQQNCLVHGAPLPLRP